LTKYICYYRVTFASRYISVSYTNVICGFRSSINNDEMVLFSSILANLIVRWFQCHDDDHGFVNAGEWRWEHTSHSKSTHRNWQNASAINVVITTIVCLSVLILVYSSLPFVYRDVMLCLHCNSYDMNSHWNHLTIRLAKMLVMMNNLYSVTFQLWLSIIYFEIAGYVSHSNETIFTTLFNTTYLMKITLTESCYKSKCK
jgi:hypothetical protein